MNNVDIAKLLGQWLQGQLPSDSTIDPASADVIIKQADWHGISPLLCHQVNSLGISGSIPGNILEHLKNSHTNAIAVQLFTNQELRTVFRLFSNNGIEYLLFKGTPLSYTLYPEAYLRVRCDTDILFPDKDTTRKAYRLLIQCGYALPNAVEGELVSQELCCCKRSQSGFMHMLDLHWKLNNLSHFSGMFTYAEIKENSQPVTMEGNPLAPGPVYALILACLHRVSHIPYGEADRLIWLYDIHLLCNQFSDPQWDLFLQLATDKKLAAVMLDSLEKSRLFLNTSLPTQVIEKLATDQENSIVKPRYHQAKWFYDINNLQSLPGWKPRLLFLKENLFPAPEYMYAKFRINQPVVLPFLYLFRILGGVPKLFTKALKSTQRPVTHTGFLISLFFTALAGFPVYIVHASVFDTATLFTVNTEPVAMFTPGATMDFAHNQEKSPSTTGFVIRSKAGLFQSWLPVQIYAPWDTQQWLPIVTLSMLSIHTDSPIQE